MSLSEKLAAHSSLQNNMWTKSVDCCPLSVDIKMLKSFMNFFLDKGDL